MAEPGGLGLRRPVDDRHRMLYPLRAHPLAAPPARVEDVLPLPHHLRGYMNQGREGSCVGWACSWLLTILNTRPGDVRRYDAIWLYRAAQAIDDWNDTPPQEGTSVRAALDVLRDTGHRRMRRGVSAAPDLTEGVAANRWAETVDELRACVAAGVPAVLGIDWHEGFDRPEQVGAEW
jgi:hypothetical protein